MLGFPGSKILNAKSQASYGALASSPRLEQGVGPPASSLPLHSLGGARAEHPGFRVKDRKRAVSDLLC